MHLIGHPAPSQREIELVIMVEVLIGEMVWVGLKPTARLHASLGRR